MKKDMDFVEDFFKGLQEKERDAARYISLDTKGKEVKFKCSDGTTFENSTNAISYQIGINLGKKHGN